MLVKERLKEGFSRTYIWPAERGSVCWAFLRHQTSRRALLVLKVCLIYFQTYLENKWLGIASEVPLDKHLCCCMNKLYVLQTYSCM